MVDNPIYATYQWYVNGVSVPFNNSIIGMEFIGSYHVIVTDSNGCSAISDTSYVSQLVTLNSISNNNFEFKVYPNPAKDILNISVSGSFPFGERWREATITIQNTLGETVYSQSNNNALKIIDMSGFANGVYFVKIGEKSFKFVKE
jgi:hypothetical protein